MLLRYGNNLNVKNDTIYFTPEMYSIIQEFDNVRDLGIQVSNSGDFKDHIDNIIKRTKKVIGWVLRSFINRSLNFLKKMWVTIIRPIIDYGSQVWSPLEGVDMDRIEKLQYNFTKLIPEIRGLSYEERLKKLNLSSLQRQFERYKIFYTWKVLQGIVPGCGIKVRSEWNSRNGLKLEVNRTGDDRIGRLRDQSFQISAPKIWNSLPIFLRNLETSSKSIFKTNLDNYLRTIPDCPRVGSRAWSKNSLTDILSN